MENDKLILAKLAIGLGCLACFMCLKRTAVNGGGHLFLPGAFAFWLISRLGLFIALFVILRFEVPSDVPTYYYEPAKMALEGKITYRDFSTSYGPLFPYIAAGPVAIWDSAKAIVLLAIIFEGIAIFLWHRVASRTLSVADSKLGLLLYLCNPVPILNIVIAGQNQIWLSCFLAAALGLSLARREFFSGLLIALSVGAVKFLSLIFVPYWWLMSKARLHFTSGIIIGLALIYLPFYWVGADILLPFKLEGVQISSGNLPYLLTLTGFNPSGHIAGLLLNLLLLGAIGMLSLLLYKNVRRGGISGVSLLGLTAILLVFMLLSKKSYSNYLNIAMLPLCFSAAVVLHRKWQHEFFLLWCCVAALEPSLWHRWLSKANLDDYLHQMASRGAMDFKLPLFILVELLVLGGYLILLWLVLRHLLKPANSGAQMPILP